MIKNVSETFLQFAVLIFLTGALVHCSPQTKSLMPPPEKVEKLEQQAQPPEIIEFIPEVDILFVLDNSRSMEEEIQVLKSNMQKFVGAIENNADIDYQIGVTLVHDSARYGAVVKMAHPVSGVVQFREKGELLPVNDAGVRFVNRENISELNQMFDIKALYCPKDQLDQTLDLSKIYDCEETQGYAAGPEIEESFSPVLAAFDSEKVANRGFHRPGAHLVVIFVTDAEDSTKEISPEKLFSELMELKGNNISHLSAYGVLCALNDNQCRNLKNNGVSTIESKSYRIRKFIDLVAKEKNVSTGKAILNLKSAKWGERLADVATEIQKRTLEMERKIYLGASPRFNVETQKLMITVKLGNKLLPEDEEKGWSFKAREEDGSENVVTVHAGVLKQEGADPTAQVSVTYTKANPTAQKVQ